MIIIIIPSLYLSCKFQGLDNISKIILSGAGNVATQLGMALQKAGYQIEQVYSRTIDSAKDLANKLHTNFTTDSVQIQPNADLYIITVSDDAVPGLLSESNFPNGLIVHTSGSLDLDILAPVSENIGVFYPLQTFSKNRESDFSTIPICIEAGNPRNLNLIKKVALKLTERVYEISSHQRKVLHLAAVFACNFPNFMYTVAEDISLQGKVDFNLLKPLILETATKVLEHSPADVQTGPAKRNDQVIMNKHLDLLSEFPQYRSLYESISREINKKHFKL